MKPVKQSSLFDAFAALVEKGRKEEVQGKPVESQLSEAVTVPMAAITAVVGDTGKAVEKSLLLAEDNPANQRLATVQLRRLGYSVELASNGAQAVDLYTKTPGRYNLILMDCQMPMMDGFEATRRIRQLENDIKRHVQIVAMTANAMQGDRENCLAVGMDDYISKPVSLEALRQTLNRVEKKLEIARHDEQADDAGTVVISHDPLDALVIKELRDLQEEGEPDFLTELIDIYLEDSLKLVDELKIAMDMQKVEDIRHSAHTLKGSSGNLGALVFSKLCYEMELCARNDDLAGAQKMLPAFLNEYQAVHEKLLLERRP